MRNCFIGTLFAIVALGPKVSAAQSAQGETFRAKVAVVNIVLGGVTSGLFQLGNGGSFWKGALHGSVGGGLIFSGKCLIAQKSTAGNWLGRSAGYVGSSVVANASANRPAFRQIFATLGPIHLQRDNNTGKLGVKLDVASSLVTTYVATRSYTSFKPGRSLKYTTLVFRDHSTKRDASAAGVILLGDPASVERGLGHELTHVAQGDSVATALEIPLEDWLFSHFPGGQTAGKYIHLGFLGPILTLAGSRIDYSDRPWEIEARWSADGC